MNPYYRDYSEFLAEHFHGKVQKISINAGFTCPNRDGTVGRGGCTYCNNQSFNPVYCTPSSDVRSQLEEGKRFFSRKYPQMKYLAYFQAYTSTHGDVAELMSLYRTALAVDGVAGLVIGTRPDCMPDELLGKLSAINARTPVIVEYGAETSHDVTLGLINRCHTWDTTVDAVVRTHNAGIATGLHLILGLPGEDEEMILKTMDKVSQLPVDTVKLHQLQIIKGTRMASDVAEGLYDVPRYSVDDYIDLCCKVICRLRKDIAIERFVSSSPDELLVSPRWGLKNYQFTQLLHNKLRTLGTGR